MQRRTLVIVVVLGTFVLLIIAILASRVGGIAIRSNATQPDQLTLTASSPALRGTPITVRWTIPADATSRPVSVHFRDQVGEQVLATTTLTAGSATITIPCTENGTSAALLLRAADTSEVLANQAVELLAPAQDCLMP